MNRRGPDLDRLDSFPRRPHRLAVIIPILLLLVVIALTYRYAGSRWPGNAGRHGPVDISETDAANRSASSQPGTLAGKQAGATSAGGFHKQ